MIIEEYKNLDGNLGLHYEKCGEGILSPFSDDRYSFFFPRCAASFEIVLPKDKARRIMDAYVFAVIPPKTTFQATATTTISDSVYFTASPSLLEDVGQHYRIDVRKKFAELISVTILPRTNWLNEIMHRYVYERAVSKANQNDATRFLEQEIVKEIYYRTEEYAQLDKSRFDLDPRSLDLRSPLLRKAMDFIEGNLFRELSVAEIAEHLATSESTLLREFRTRLQKTPQNYIIDRRLDEAMILLKGQRYSVSQVSDIVGYENVSAFSSAFKKRFGSVPSQIARKDLSTVTEF